MKLLFTLSVVISCLFGQLDTTIINIDNMPIRTKLLWGDKGLFRQINFGPNNRKDEIRLRVRMLQNHQKLALASLGLVAYQSYLGNQMAEGDYSKQDAHRTFSKITWGTYMVSASLSYFAPPAQKYNKRISSMKVHQWLSYIHFAGMMALPVLGKNIVTSNDYDKALTLHQNVASITFASMSLSALLTFLPY
tara:strand:- start:5579 stop:6154 length:576 start_codon:yes stop_codon:yes gene_type:complete